ncbi:MAG: putative AAA+ superfamily ATPase [Gammaproteobacteria bacterium]|jgi:predicted AAA+ superfamily ATPase
MLGLNQNQLFNAFQIGGSLGVSDQSILRYLDLMVDLMLARRLQPWRSNVGKRLFKSP